MRKCQRYTKHLHSYHFKFQRDLAWFLSLRCCSICFKRYGLEPHHLGYLLVDTFAEWITLRYLCRRCHKWVQHFFWIRVKATIPLIVMYYLAKFTYWGTIGIIRILLYILSWGSRTYAVKYR